MLKALFDAFRFLSIIPLGMPKSLEDVARNMYLFPVVGAVLGLLAGLFIDIISQGFPATISAAVGFFALLILTGFHHLDGLLDFGDALVYRGPKEKRIEIMHDAGIGVGGFAIGLFITLLGVLATYEFISKGGSIAAFFIVSETLAKTAMVFAAGLGAPAFKGSGSIFVEEVRKRRWQLPLSLALAGLVAWPFSKSLTPILLAVPLFSALCFVFASKRLIGGVSGDVFGALNESTRVLGMLVMIWMPL